MRKVFLYISMSLDGYIADKSGRVDWIIGDGSDNNSLGSYNDFFETIDTVVMGYKTYHQIVNELSPNEWVYSGKKCFVITHKKFDFTHEICFTDKNLGMLISELKNKNGKDIWICGGADVVNQLIESDLIDKYCITVIPTILGSGVRLFNYHEKEIKLRLVSTYNYNGIIDLIYERRQ